jgi:class 3 adenylate cyclase
MYTSMIRTNNINKIEAQAQAERAIVRSLFPSNVRDRLIQDAEGQVAKDQGYSRKINESMSDSSLTNALSSESIFSSKPIADFSPDVSVMFADLVGFTAWSSARDPTQVFAFLEVIHHSFDMIAKKEGVFKVETVGDCYVAVVGLPVPRKDHAEVMASFATDCLFRLHGITADLDIRIGLHSGPVTAGVLRGGKGLFQLFGDTLNTANRIETTGMRGKIHVSQETADLLIARRKRYWLSPVRILSLPRAKFCQGQR